MLDGHVLVLNRFFQVVQITSVRRVLTLLYKGQVRAVSADYATWSFENWRDIPVQPADAFITTPSRNILVPWVVQLLRFDKVPRQEVKFSRANIYIRDQNRCQYCGKKFSSSELSLDHVIPISRGGRSSWENVVCACLPCNVRKGNKLLAESDMALIRRPERPRWHPLHRLQGRPYPDIWKNFLDQAYWSVELSHDWGTSPAGILPGANNSLRGSGYASPGAERHTCSTIFRTKWTGSSRPFAAKPR